MSHWSIQGKAINAFNSNPYSASYNLSVNVESSHISTLWIVLSVCLSICLSVCLSFCQPLKPQGKKLSKQNLRKGIDLGLCIRRGAALHPCIRLCFRHQIFYFDFFIFEDHDVIRR